MSKKQSTKREYGTYIWRCGERIDLKKEVDRFTFIKSNRGNHDDLVNIPNVKNIQPVNNHVFKVEVDQVALDVTMTMLRSHFFGLVTHHVYRPADTEGTMFYLTDKIIVRFSPEMCSSSIDKLIERYCLIIINEYPHPLNTYLLQITSSSGQNPVKVANRIADEQGVIFAEPNMVHRFQTAWIPPDSLFTRQWYLNAQTGPQLYEESSVSAVAAWEITKGSRDVVVAVIDNGFDISHPDFQGLNKVVHPKDYVDGDSNPFPEFGAQFNHGTPCAGIAIAESNGTGVVGIAHGCAFMPVRFSLSASDDQLVDIFEEVSRKADVISCSWSTPPVNSPLSQLLFDTLERIATTGGSKGKGCVLCFAAGNYNAPIRQDVNNNGFTWIDSQGQQRTTEGSILNGFAAHPSVITVAASTSLNKHAAYSNWGSEICICAPSNNFHPLDRQQFVAGRSVWTTDDEAYGRGFTISSRFTNDFGGTSAATALVAGIAALVLSVNPNLSATEVKEILQTTADKITDPDPDIMSGANMGQYDTKGQSNWFGFGKVNAARAVTESQRRLAG